ncbi:MAG: hypothetical protein QM602_10960 [Microbacterium sp.]
MIGVDPDRAICSRAGCTADARWLVDWRNPRIHAPGRTKTWAACDEHVAYLRDFLAAREFPVTVRPLGELLGTP